MVIDQFVIHSQTLSPQKSTGFRYNYCQFQLWSSLLHCILQLIQSPRCSHPCSHVMGWPHRHSQESRVPFFLLLVDVPENATHTPNMEVSFSRLLWTQSTHFKLRPNSGSPILILSTLLLSITMLGLYPWWVKSLALGNLRRVSGSTLWAVSLT